MTQAKEYPLGNIFDIARGGSPRPIQKFLTDAADGVNWIMIGDAAEGQKYITKTKHRIRSDGVSRSREVFPGDFILSNSMSFGRPYILKTGGCIHDGWLVLRKKTKEVDEDYFYHLLGSPQVYREFCRRAAGACVKNLNKDLVSSVTVPLPPLPEQKRIAAILDKADELRAKRRQAIAKVDELLQATFNTMFGSCNRPPISIGEPTFGDSESFEELSTVARLATGHTPDRNRPDYWDGDVPWVSLTDIRRVDGTTTSATLQSVTEEGIKHSSAVKLPAGTVCFSRTATVGFVTVMGREMATSQDFVNWICSDRIDPIYLMWALRMARPYLLSKASGSTHKTIYYRDAEQFQVLLPPVNLQRTFVAIATSSEVQKARYYRQETEMNALFASLQQRAFKGEL